MEVQSSFADIERSGRRRVTKREQFLRMMNGIIPWDAWIPMIKPFYPDGMHGRPVRGIETMLRMYLLQVWFTLSDEGVYRGLAKNMNRFNILFASANLLMCARAGRSLAPIVPA